jgi:hypothetical protein
MDLDRITGLTGYFCLVGLYPVDPVDPVRKINRPFDKKAHDRQNTLLRHLSAGGGFDACPSEENSLFDLPAMP